MPNFYYRCYYIREFGARLDNKRVKTKQTEMDKNKIINEKKDYFCSFLFIM